MKEQQWPPLENNLSLSVQPEVHNQTINSNVLQALVIEQAKVKVKLTSWSMMISAIRLPSSTYARSSYVARRLYWKPFTPVKKHYNLGSDIRNNWQERGGIVIVRYYHRTMVQANSLIAHNRSRSGIYDIGDDDLTKLKQIYLATWNLILFTSIPRKQNDLQFQKHILGLKIMHLCGLYKINSHSKMASCQRFFEQC